MPILIFQLVISYNPGYQSLLKDLKPSTKQRFAAFEFDYPSAELEAQIVSAGDRARRVSRCTVGEDCSTRRGQLKGHGLTEGISTRLLVYAAHLDHATV
jgi:nitric oxide reductase NorQ protein